MGSETGSRPQGGHRRRKTFKTGSLEERNPVWGIFQRGENWQQEGKNATKKKEKMEEKRESSDSARG